MKKTLIGLVGLVGIGIYFLNGSYSFDDVINFFTDDAKTTIESATTYESYNIDDIPVYTENIYVVLNDNIPLFTDNDKEKNIFEEYMPLDNLNRAGTAYAKIDSSLMPTEDRESIGTVKPSGWQTVKYDIVSGKYLYNRSHLIGFQLTGENANEENLITGTRYFNVEGMLPFENMVADYIKETGNPVLYRVTPVYDGDNLVASGVIMEALSTLDDEIMFNVYVYNVQPGVTINYSDGTSYLT